MITKAFPTVALIAAGALAPGIAQAQTPAPVTVIQGGLLIDGTGRPPIENSVIVIEGDRFKTIGRSGEVAIPAGAQVIDVKGKTVMPGFIDGHCHWEAFWGELYLHLGITTCVEIETNQDGPWALAQKDGTNMGKICGPRIWPSGQALGARMGELETEGSRAWRGYITIDNAEQARAAVQQKKRDGYDVIKLSEYLTARSGEGGRRRSPPDRHGGDRPHLGRHRVRQCGRRRRRAHLGRRLHLDHGPRSPAQARHRSHRRQDRRRGGGRALRARELRQGHRPDGGASRGLDADHRQVAAAAVSERAALLGRRSRRSSAIRTPIFQPPFAS